MKVYAHKNKYLSRPRMRDQLVPSVVNQQRAALRQSLRSPSLQTKLKVGEFGDEYEQEADRIADQVMRMPDAEITSATVQRKYTDGDDEDGEEEILQAKLHSSDVPELESTFHHKLSALTGQGSPLSSQMRAFFEPRIGHDFSGVRIHQGARAAQLARTAHARAFTHEQDVVFAPGEYAPQTQAGKHLLAHELTHVVQQGHAPSLVEGQTAGTSQTAIQRRIGDGHDLTADRFAGNRLLEAVYDNERLIRRGSRGRAVRLIQESLIAQGYDFTRFGADGIFGTETEAAVRLFQIDGGAELLDGIIGPETMTLLNQHDPGTTVPTRPAAPGAVPAAAGAVFEEHPDEQFAGYDDRPAPNWLVVPQDGRRHARVRPNPANARPTYRSQSNAIAEVDATPDGLAVTGIADGNTVVEAREGVNVLDTLRVEVKRRLDRTVDYHFMSDSAAPVPNATTRAPASANTLTSTINRIWERQANTRFRTGVVDSPVVPGDLGGQVLWNAHPPNEWNTITAFATGGNYNVFLVWEYEQDATPAVDDTNAGTLGGSTLLEDNECADALTVAHEAGHFLNMGMPHTADGIMSGCPGADRRRVRKGIADQVNP
ncbi:MAG: DUF4157 domain-containing protein [Desulfuromonadales bacterium]|nr:DUF4157 domain-containing protein [Desulfuromonadales bacterium]